MNVKEYIASGIIESYVMGLATEAERQEFEALCAQYPEIAEARTAYEVSLEEQLLKDAVPAPKFLQQQIKDKITASATESETNGLEEERTPVRTMGVWRWVAAASLILLAGSVYWAVSTNKKYQDALAKNNQLQEQINSRDTALKGPEVQQPVSDFKMANIMEGGQPAASIYWDTTSKDVYLMIKNMPQPPSDKQYQLWALLPEDGAAPVDLGMIEIKQNRLLYRMKNVQNAKAFAITLEPKGGSPKPTSTPMVSSQPVNL